MKHFFSLKIRLNILFIILAIYFLSLGIVSFYSFSTTLKESIQRTVLYRAAESADFTRREIEAFKNNLEGVTLRSEITSMDWEQQKPILLSECERLKIDNIQIADLNGHTNSTNGLKQNISTTQYFKNAKNGITVFTDPLTSTIDTEPAILCAMPISNKHEQVIGVLIASLDPQFLFRIIDSRRVGMTGYGFIVNKQDKIIAHPFSQALDLENGLSMAITVDLKNKNLNPILKRISSGEVGHSSYWYQGIEYLVAFAPISSTNWSLAMTVPKSEIFYEIDALKSRFIVLTTISLLIILSLGLVIQRYTSQHREMENLQENVEKSEQLLKESKELDQIKTDFFANISHELRTPLNVILGTLQLLNLQIKTDKCLDPDHLSRHLQIIKQNCLRSIRLSNNLIDTTKIDSGFYEVHLKNCNIVSIIEEITLSTADYVKGKGILLQFDTEFEEKIIACDTDKIERIMLNLLSNAVKFTSTGGCIYVNIYYMDSAVRVAIRDTGIGIPENKLSHIFERFRQVDESLTRNHEGSGIGLSLVKSLVEMHKGKITVSSEPGVGSTFTFELPDTRIADDTLCSPITDQNYYTEKANIEFSDICI